MRGGPYGEGKGAYTRELPATHSNTGGTVTVPGDGRVEWGWVGFFLGGGVRGVGGGGLRGGPYGEGKGRTQGSSQQHTATLGELLPYPEMGVWGGGGGGGGEFWGGG